MKRKPQSTKRCPVCDLSMRLYPHELCRELRDCRKRLAKIGSAMCCIFGLTEPVMVDGDPDLPSRLRKIRILAKGAHATTK